MKQYSKNPKMRRRRIISLCAATLLLLLALILLITGVRSCIKHTKAKNNAEKTEVAAVAEEASQTAVKGQPAKATLLSTGDYLIHKEIFTNVQKSDGTWDFDSVFNYVRDEIKAADFAVCDFEFSIIDGTDYSFYPLFRLPASTADAVKKAGFDLCITANNHIGDDREEGVYRTIKTLNKAGLKTTGAVLKPEDKHYQVVEVNGIKIGMVNYTFGTVDGNGLKALNGNAPLDADCSACVNVFQNEKLDDLYAELQDCYDGMIADGAETCIAYMHWGNEYQLTASPVQEAVAQKLCDMGFSTIIGGHPHVIEPSAVITSENGNRAFCIYSTGNMVSNQRREYIPEANGYTEDAIFVYTTFERDNDGNVTLSKVDYTPVWMNKYAANGVQNYRLIPLSDLSKPSEYGLSGNALANAKASKDRTDGLVAEGFAAYNKG